MEIGQRQLVLGGGQAGGAAGPVRRDVHNNRSAGEVGRREGQDASPQAGGVRKPLHPSTNRKLLWQPTTHRKLREVDPRPDLAEDHRLWLAVLILAERIDKELHGVMHGLRCAGCRLEIVQGRQGPHLKLDYRPALEDWPEVELRRQWLDPRRERIRALFREALRAKEWAERGSVEARKAAS